MRVTLLDILGPRLGVRKLLLVPSARRPFLLEKLLECYLAFGRCRLFDCPALLSLVKLAFEFAYATFEHGLAPNRAGQVSVRLGLRKSVGDSRRVERPSSFACLAGASGRL